jgi:Mor family transcriptional regulator
MRPRKTMDRNREIFSRFKAGMTVERLAEQHGLTIQRIRALLIDERHRHNLSPELFYRARRRAGGAELTRLALSRK